MAFLFNYCSQLCNSSGKRVISMILLLFLLANPVLLLAQTPVFINEIHYDNTGTDETEAVEIAGPAGTDVTGWKIVRYNGADAAFYTSPAANPSGSDTFSGTIPNLCDGYGVLVVYYQANGLQNGAPDGIALVDNLDNVVQFFSYEGTFTATNGPASGMTSVDLGVAETSDTPVGFSLQLAGTGSVAEDFTWNAPAAATFGLCNTGQTFLGGADSAPFVSSTAPTSGATNVAITENIRIDFNEPVTVTGAWFRITGAASAEHSASVSGGPQSYTLDPNLNFVYEETVTVTVFAANVSDNDTDDPPDNMTEDYTFSFTITAQPGMWVINEIHADPDANNGDANGDGVVDTADDEFVEIINTSGAEADISGWTLSDAVGVKHTFPDGSQVANNCTIVIFGGGTPTGEFGNGTFQTASSGQLGLNNTGDTVTLNNGTTDVASYTYGSEGGDNQSLTRDPDITGPEPLVKHSTATGANGALFSPGTKVDGSRFSGCGPQFPAVEIYEIQGSGLASPYVGQTVTTENNVVTAVASNGFFIQTPPERSDQNDATSDGIFVYTGSAAVVAIGDRVNVTGNVAEYESLTEFNNAPTVVVISAGQPLPEPVPFDDQNPSPVQPQSEIAYERYEGMRVQVATGTVTGPTGADGNAHVVAKDSRTFREPGIAYPGESGLPVWDGNPEVFGLNPDRLGLANVALSAGSEFSATGILSQTEGAYQLWPTVLSVNAQPTLPAAVRSRAQGEIMIGTLNLWNLSQNQPDAGAYQDRLTKLSDHIRNLMQAPEILAVQEVANLLTLQDLAGQIQADDAQIVYTAHLVEGNDGSGIDVGYLVRDNVQVQAVTQLGADEIFSYDGSLLHDRPPLLLQATFADGNAVQVLNLHLRSMIGIDDPVEGERVRQKRHEQATSVSLMVQDIQTGTPEVNLVVCGDFNAFEFTDGYVDVLGQILGTPADASAAMIPGTDEVEPDLSNRILDLSASERYSFVQVGNAQVLDHALTSQALASRVSGIQFARANADAPNDYQDDASTSLRASDHDGLVLYLLFGNRFDASGHVTYNGYSRPVSGAVLSLSQAGVTARDTTDASGAYRFVNYPEGQAEIVPDKQGDQREAITASDALLILQYLRDLVTLTADQKFSADVNEDGIVNSVDALTILRYVAFFSDRVGATGQWRFIPAQQAFYLNSDQVANFKAYLKGDATLNWGETPVTMIAAQIAKPASAHAEIALRLGEIQVAGTEPVDVPISVSGPERVTTLVFSLSYDAGCLVFESVIPNCVDESLVWEVNSSEPGRIHLALAAPNGYHAANGPVHLRFRVVRTPEVSQSIRLEITHALINDCDVAQRLDGYLHWAEPALTGIPNRVALLPNYPNPFNPSTRIRYQLPHAAVIDLQIYNLRGEAIRTLAAGARAAGHHEAVWDGLDRNGRQVPSGVYVILLQAGELRLSRKILKIQ